MARFLGRRWGQVGHAPQLDTVHPTAAPDGASARLNVMLLLVTCLLSMQLLALVANLPVRSSHATGLASTATAGNDASELPQGGAITAILADLQQQVVTTPRPMLHVFVPPSMVAWRLTQGQPCHDVTMFVAHISAWTVPPGCYGSIYRPNPRKYHAEVAFGTCTWWVEALHQPNMLSSGRYRQGIAPKPGAIAVIAAGVQGAGKTGHYAEVIAVAPGGYWMLVSEMNFHWRAAGFGRVDFRYIHVGDGVSFLW